MTALATALLVGCATASVPTWREAHARWGWAVALRRVGYDCEERGVTCAGSGGDAILQRRAERREAYDTFLDAFPATVRVELLDRSRMAELLEDEVPDEVDEHVVAVVARLDRPALPPDVQLRIVEVTRLRPPRPTTHELVDDPEELVVALGGAPRPSTMRVHGWTSPPPHARYREAQLARPYVPAEMRYGVPYPEGRPTASASSPSARTGETATEGAMRIGLPGLPIVVALLPLLALSDALAPSRRGGQLTEPALAWHRAIEAREGADVTAWASDPRVEARLRLRQGTWRDGSVATFAYARHPATKESRWTTSLPPPPKDDLAVVVVPTANGVDLAPMRVHFTVARTSDLRADLGRTKLGPLPLRGAYDLLLPRVRDQR